MANLVNFPNVKDERNAKTAMAAIEKRFGIPFLEYMGLEGDRELVQQKVVRAMRKETLQKASQSIRS